MGSRGAFWESGGFSAPFEYESFDKIEDIKVIRHKTKNNAGLPEYANTSDAYILYDKDGRPKQLRIYEGRRPKYDVDFDHASHHKENQHEGYHVHIYEDVPNEPHRVRSKNSGSMTPEDSEIWQDLIDELLRRRNNA